MAKKSNPLTRSHLGRIARASLDNSAALLADAQLLLACGRWARAHSLAVLAAEEFGKFYLCVTTGQNLENMSQARWVKFWEDFRSHRAKFAMWFGQHVDGQDWGPVGSAGDEEWLRAWDSRVDQAEAHDHGKQAGFYVDFDIADDKMRVPAELFTERQTTQLVNMVASVVEPAMASTPDDPEQLVTTSPLLHALQEEIKAMRNLPREEAAAAMRALVAKYVGLDEEFLVPDAGENG